MFQKKCCFIEAKMDYIMTDLPDPKVVAFQWIPLMQFKFVQNQDDIRRLR